MKRLLLFFSFVVLAVNLFAQNIPKRPVPPRLVNDYTHTLTADQVATLENKLVAYDDSTSTQVVIVIVPTTDDYAPVDYATKLGREWGVGNAKTNNGVVLLVAKDDRTLFISPGYGLEGAIPDITAKSIVEDVIKPNFKENDFYRGLDLGTTAIIKAAAGEYKAPAGYRSKGNGRGGSLLGIIIIVFIVVMLVGRGGGGRGGGMMSRRGYGALPWIVGGMLSGGRGGGGGGWGGGSSGGGGFGGFGGGSFGGGGAGGSW